MVLASASDSYAQSTSPIQVVDVNGNICSAYNGFTAKIVNCIQGTVVWATNRYLANFNQAFIDTVNVLATFATLLFGFLLFSGRAQASAREAFTLAFKVGIVIFLVNMGAFATIFPAITNSIDWLINLVSQYTAVSLSNRCPYDPFVWNRIDCALNLLIGGILPGSTIAMGLLGLVSAMLFSGGVGIAIFFFGLALILTVIMAFFQALFILLSAYIALALLAILAPMMIPLILFRTTKGYFEKWLRLMIGVILQPLFLFTYLTIFLIALEISIFTGPYSVYRSIACDAADNSNFQVGTYVNGSGAIGERNGASALMSLVAGQDSSKFAGNPENTVAQQGGPLGEEATKKVADKGNKLYNNGAGISIDLAANAVDIPWLAQGCNGMNGLTYFIRLLLSMFTALAVVYIFYTMLQFIPYLGTLISSDLFGLPNLSQLMPMDGVNSTKLAQKFGFGGGQSP